MTALKKWPMWLWMLAKRLYKKPVFLILLVLIPLVVIGYRFSVRDAGTVMTVALVQEKRDSTADTLFSDLQEDSRLIRYQILETEHEARELLAAGKVDTAWIFADDLPARIETYANNPTRENAFITVLSRSEDVTQALIRERLSSSIYEEVAKIVYLNYIRSNFPQLQDTPDEALIERYESAAFSQDLFTFGETEGPREQSNFLLSPLRGLLGVIIALCGLAAAMQFLSDRERGTYAWLSPRWQILPEVSCQLVAVVQLAVVAFICLLLSGLSQAFWKELAAIILYSLCVAAFSMMLCKLLNSIKWLATLLPILCVVMLVVCPVFFDIGKLRTLQWLLPPTYYIRAVYEPVWLGYMALYTAACCGIWYLAGKLRKT